MGKGDKKTRRGKITNKSYGVRRKAKKKDNPAATSLAKTKNQEQGKKDEIVSGAASKKENIASKTKALENKKSKPTTAKKETSKDTKPDK